MLKIAIQRSCLAVLMLALSTTAFSREIGYDFVQGTYSSITVSSGGSDLDGDGFTLSGAFSVSPNIAFSGSYTDTSYDTIQGFDFSSNEFQLGVIAHVAVAPNTDLFGSFSVIEVEQDLSSSTLNFSDDDTGNVISAGVRHMATDSIEVNAGISRIDVFDDTETSYGVGSRAYTGEAFSLGIGYRTSDDVDSFQFSARVDFK